MRTTSPVVLSLLALGCVSEHGPLTNRMAQSGTRYLTRAARQPVSWQPWGREAFALAARLDRPVLLYVGADDCRWCAVMDREAYGDPVLGAMIDSMFVPVRVDRDERPDIARRYQAAVQWLAGLRGYPITVFLTPEGSAFFGGTYFPADDPVTGRGLKQLLPDVAKSYREQRGVILQKAALVRQLAVTHAAWARGVLQPAAVRSKVAAVRAVLQAAAGAHAALGGFMHTQAVSLLLAAYARTGDSSYVGAGRGTPRAAPVCTVCCRIRCKWLVPASRPTATRERGATSMWQRISPTCSTVTSPTRWGAATSTPSPPIRCRRRSPTVASPCSTICFRGRTPGRRVSCCNSLRQRATLAIAGAPRRPSKHSLERWPAKTCARRATCSSRNTCSRRASRPVPGRTGARVISRAGTSVT